MRKNCSSDREKLLKFEAESREFSKFLRSDEQFIKTVKDQNKFWYQRVSKKKVYKQIAVLQLFQAKFPPST